MQSMSSQQAAAAGATSPHTALMTGSSASLTLQPHLQQSSTLQPSTTSQPQTSDPSESGTGSGQSPFQLSQSATVDMSFVASAAAIVTVPGHEASDKAGQDGLAAPSGEVTKEPQQQPLAASIAASGSHTAAAPAQPVQAGASGSAAKLSAPLSAPRAPPGPPAVPPVQASLVAPVTWTPSPFFASQGPEPVAHSTAAGSTQPSTLASAAPSTTNSQGARGSRSSLEQPPGAASGKRSSEEQPRTPVVWRGSAAAAAAARRRSQQRASFDIPMGLLLSTLSQASASQGGRGQGSGAGPSHAQGVGPSIAGQQGQGPGVEQAGSSRSGTVTGRGSMDTHSRLDAGALLRLQMASMSQDSGCVTFTSMANLM